MLKNLFALMVISLLTMSSLHAAGQGTPFLITGKMPHYTGIIKANWEDTRLNLTQEQKTKLVEVRKNTLNVVFAVKKKLAPLEQEVALKILSGSTPKELSTLVNKIAKYKIEATTAHLQCIYDTQEILSKEQLDLLGEL
ncbi:MAG: hypothetical protein OQK48_04390 [Sulfurimonas sp.]|uniref:hypothetical protein n=1 Tax=Sulfurimonas sp. TaxID=2022749 RepID=UPI002639AC70|nr:hypothetical protein [Sulfurimonas sp.]MCW8896011.1 hypothetical protein [Sulfurimonas sp.]MCW8954160.1 hypothetical protein [Sulfurimonas sp.]MCW9066981.1 hypothetical protein [Sulfurimonas sp.]